MSEPMKTHHTKAKKYILCVSEQGQVYNLPRTTLNHLNKYKKSNVTPAEALLRAIFGGSYDGATVSMENSVSPAEAFAKINAKYTKTGALLKAIRLREGLSQAKFCALIHVTQGDLSKMERGERPIGKILADRIAKKFGSHIIEDE